MLSNMRRLLAGFCLLLLSAALAISAEIRVVGIPGEGTAIIYVSGHKAVITDGGKQGAGLAEATIDGKTALKWLHDTMKVTDLAIECSHPDSDHLGAIVKIIKTDPTLQKFA